MSITILDVLENAQYNFESSLFEAKLSAKNQLKNAITLLEKGYNCFEDYNEIVDKYGSVEQAPEQE